MLRWDRDRLLESWRERPPALLLCSRDWSSLVLDTWFPSSPPIHPLAHRHDHLQKTIPFLELISMSPILRPQQFWLLILWGGLPQDELWGSRLRITVEYVTLGGLSQDVMRGSRLDNGGTLHFGGSPEDVLWGSGPCGSWCSTSVPRPLRACS